ncbi:MAG: N-acetyltransferase [Planctomycetaceae bacterium]|jgi:putative acetyltransferase|nr:N-acetyltransferase [Planctomycetaceae bacterium]MDG2387749.1 N-acetyltransferase [Planctomycetaceae bacterium]
MTHIRSESAIDYDAVRYLNTAAFETDAEAGLVDALRDQCESIISLVAEKDDLLAGHILFSPVTLPGHNHLKILGLAPMAVLPDFQRQGIGSELVTAGLNICREQGWDAVVVLGYPEFYPRFGFVPASQFKIGCEYDVPDEVFMLVELNTGALDGCWGTVNYHSAFADL